MRPIKLPSSGTECCFLSDGRGPSIVDVVFDDVDPDELIAAIGSKPPGLLYAVDAFLHPLQVEHPAWGRGMDLDAEVAIATRHSLLERAAERGHVIGASHWDVVVELSRGPDGRTSWTSAPAQ